MRKSNLCSHWSDALTTELRETGDELGHMLWSCMTCVLCPARISNVESVMIIKERW